MKYKNIQEEELKNKVAKDYFYLYDCTKIIGDIDFCVCLYQGQNELFEQESLLWAEAKTGSSDIHKSFIQLILTIGKARTFDKFLPPAMLGAFDGEKIAFIPYNEIHDVFYMNDFNWNVTPSKHDTKEFKIIHEKVKTIIDKKTLLFNFIKDDRELTQFIKKNFADGRLGLTKTRIDKNNFMVIYNKWLETVKPTIAVNWDIAKKSGIIDGDFYLADLLSQENNTLKEKLFVLLKNDHYELDRKLNETGMFERKQADFKDKQVAHTQFWNRYDRPPKEEYWDYIVERRDLLVPQDVRERKGSFFTPRIWVELSQKYLTDVLGENWQDDYFIWDCAAGTGNLLAGLTNKYNIWASTLDTQDVEVMKDRIKNGANLLEDHVFQFDFLNDEFTKLPKPLQDIINDPERRKKLVVYINPPYAEVSGDIKSNTKKGVGFSKSYDKYSQQLGSAKRELFAQFLMRIYCEIPNSKIANFSKLKNLQSSNFSDFREKFRAKLEKFFIVPAKTFDNVTGIFPIGFFIWDTNKKEVFGGISADVFDKNENFLGNKFFYSYNKDQFINRWISLFKNSSDAGLGYLAGTNMNDFQSNNIICILNRKEQLANPRGIWINKNALIPVSVYFSIRKVIPATWLNDRDQFLYPNEGWETDTEFQNDCLAYTLFSNNISSKFGVNHWIPFTEYQVGARDKFNSNFMTDFITGKTAAIVYEPTLFYKPHNEFGGSAPKEHKFSEIAQLVFSAGKELWKYYHKQPKCNVNASLYDIREHFQGRNNKGKMNNKSEDETYMLLISALRDTLKQLAKKIEPKVYEYGFLKE